ncbi:MAG: SsrA-binding protein SmpB [Chlamydiae bacterium]|nr:SsrA-binding protein SmpB [Chlamydiota bacterium]MBI3276680.1 SsrA-binding protein SmpB [Chlamydiota bacterium]
MGSDTLIHNRKARFDFSILETFEVGIVLKGTEVKSIRGHKAHLNDSFALIERGEVILYNFHIDPYAFGNRSNHDPLRKRKLLLHKNEIQRLVGKLTQKRLTLVPLSIYLKRGRVKVEMALAERKLKGDKREDLKKKASDREAQAAMKQRVRNVRN